MEGMEGEKDVTFVTYFNRASENSGGEEGLRDEVVGQEGMEGEKDVTIITCFRRTNENLEGGGKKV